MLNLQKKRNFKKNFLKINEKRMKKFVPTSSLDLGTFCLLGENAIHYTIAAGCQKVPNFVIINCTPFYICTRKGSSGPC